MALGQGGAVGSASFYRFFVGEEMMRPQAAAGPILADFAARLACGSLTPVIGEAGSRREINAIAWSLLVRNLRGKPS